ncbi:hypothetical protein RSP799_18630 [Ralstonia solanacearum]|uniref:Hypothethical protein (Modular protein) n=1 Tax=Ralstonia solanacearum TaxID=305 RepID=A0A0S4TQS3_RALSL|nr:hypothetical protein RSP799_18630 [Ralstonia solanacearum]CUV12350.1 Hypothethical protein (modular protein) [Ralstonia solanacearum]
MSIHSLGCRRFGRSGRFDEVTFAPDPATVGEVLNVIGGQVDEGLTCVPVMHEMAVARAISDTIHFTERGAIVEHEAADRLFAARAVGTPSGATGNACAMACRRQQRGLRGPAGPADGRPSPHQHSQARRRGVSSRLTMMVPFQGETGTRCDAAAAPATVSDESAPTSHRAMPGRRRQAMTREPGDRPSPSVDVG